MFRFLERRRERKRQEEKRQKAEELRRQNEVRAREFRVKFSRYPVREFSRPDFDQLPKNVGTEFLKTCPLGTWFLCKPVEGVEIIVVGQVVKGDDLLCDQWGAGLSVPERGINRYQVKILETANFEI